MEILLATAVGFIFIGSLFVLTMKWPDKIAVAFAIFGILFISTVGSYILGAFILHYIFSIEAGIKFR